MRKAIRIVFAILTVAVFGRSAIAAPSISGVSGAFSEGSQVTVNGSGFGSKSSSAPWLYDDFDSGATNGANVLGRTSPIGGRTWNYYNMGGGGGPTVYDNSQSYNGSYSTTESNTGDGNNAWVGGMGMQKRYMSYRILWTGNPSGGAFKFDRTQSGTQQGAANPPYDACPGVGWGSSVGGHINNCDNFTRWLGFPPTPSPQDTPQMSINTWHRVETYFEMGSKNVADGTFMVWVDNTLYSNYRNQVVMCGTSADVCQIDSWIMLLIANSGPMQSWTDDVYVDNTLQRVEICDASTFAARSHCEIQIPSAWASSSIDFSVKRNGFNSGSTAYLYVFDDSGATNSSGYPVTISGGGTTYTVTPSAGSNGSISPNTPQTVNSGSTTAFTVTPSGGYTASVGGTCGGNLVGTTYTTNAVTANCTVSATFSPDTTPPVISSPLPTGTQPYGTTSVTLQVTTNENATCRYSATDVAYASMASAFGSTGGTTHQQTGFAVSNGQNYTRYVRCIDSFGNANTSSSTISFSVSAVNETILDNDGAGSSQSGSWSQSTYVAGYYGANYHYAPEAVGHWFQWTTSISPGTYVVYARWPAIVGRPTNAQYEITHSSGTATVGANQTENGNQWNMLGTYTFGSTATVRLLSSASGPEGAAADAVRFLAAAGDVTAPSTTISTSDHSTIYSDSLSVTGTASDAVGVTGCKWRIGSAPNASNGTDCTGTTSFSCSTSGYSIGSNALHVGCYDTAGNYGTDSITVSYPCKKLAIPSGLSFVGLVANPPSNATLSFDWSDVTTHADGSALIGDLANYRTYWGTVSGGPYNTSSSASSQISVGPTNANVTYYARVAAESSVNSICNSDQTAEISLFADTVPPVLSGLNPSGNYPKTAANVALGVTTNEAATCRHGSAGSAWSSKTAFSTTGATSHSATLAVWAGLVKRICYQCRDALLNESAESCTTFSVSAKPKAGVFN